MKRIGNLFEKVVGFNNLLLAAKKAFRGKKMKKSAGSFYFYLESELLSLQDELTSGRYVPKPYDIFEIREPKIRRIAAADFRDRVVHHAICNVLEPIFERRLLFDSYACRVGKGTHLAIKRLQQFSRKYAYSLKWDIQKYFESIDHEVLRQLLRRIIKDRNLLSLLDRIIDHSVPGNPEGKGLPIGNLTSQYFANLYLGELDHFVKDHLRIEGYIRYMDDSIALSNDKRQLLSVLEEVRNFLTEKLQLNLKEKAIQIAPVTEGIPFLGFRIFPSMVRLQRNNLVRWRRKLRKKHEHLKMGFISEEKFISSVQSMIAHITHSNSLTLRRKELERFYRWA